MLAIEFIEWVEKAVGYKYKSKKMVNGKWRYEYEDEKGHFSHKKLLDHDHYQKGHVFSAGEGKGHWKIEEVHGDRLVITNTETGSRLLSTKEDFSSGLKNAHKESLHGHSIASVQRKADLYKAALAKDPDHPTTKRAKTILDKAYNQAKESGLFEEGGEGMKGLDKAYKSYAKRGVVREAALKAKELASSIGQRMKEAYGKFSETKAGKLAGKLAGITYEWTIEPLTPSFWKSMLSELNPKGVERIFNNENYRIWEEEKSKIDDYTRGTFGGEKGERVQKELAERERYYVQILQELRDDQHNDACDLIAKSPDGWKYHFAADQGYNSLKELEDNEFYKQNQDKMQYMWSKYGLGVSPFRDTFGEKELRGGSIMDKGEQSIDDNAFNAVISNLDLSGSGLNLKDGLLRSGLKIGFGRKEYFEANNAYGYYSSVREAVFVSPERMGSEASTGILVHEIIHGLDNIKAKKKFWDEDEWGSAVPLYLSHDKDSAVNKLVSVMGDKYRGRGGDQDSDYLASPHEVVSRISQQYYHDQKNPRQDIFKNHAGHWDKDVLKKHKPLIEEALKELGISVSDMKKALALTSAEFIEWVEKAYGTKFDRKWWANGKWNYYYRDKKHGGRHSRDSHIAHHHLTNHDHYTEGAAFSAGVNKGHWHIKSVDGNKITIHNDETGITKTLTKKAFENMLVRSHGRQVANHYEHGLSRRLELAKAAYEKSPKAAGTKKAFNELRRWIGDTGATVKVTAFGSDSQADRIYSTKSEAELFLDRPKTQKKPEAEEFKWSVDRVKLHQMKEELFPSEEVEATMKRLLPYGPTEKYMSQYDNESLRVKELVAKLPNGWLYHYAASQGTTASQASRSKFVKENGEAMSYMWVRHGLIVSHDLGAPDTFSMDLFSAVSEQLDKTPGILSLREPLLSSGIKIEFPPQGVSSRGDDVWGYYSPQKTSIAVTAHPEHGRSIFSHEVVHALDNVMARELGLGATAKLSEMGEATHCGDLVLALKNNYKFAGTKDDTGGEGREDYYRRPTEILARAIQQYEWDKTNEEPVYNGDRAFWDKDVLRKHEPLIKEALKELGVSVGEMKKALALSPMEFIEWLGGVADG